MASNIYYRKSRGVDKSVLKRNDGALYIQREGMTTWAHQQRPHNHQAQHLNRRHPQHSPFRLCQVRWNAWPSASHFPMSLTQLMIYRQSSLEGSHTVGKFISLPIPIALWD
ncbi:hypothetical protein J1N35_015391 [Gossypium stocksii]|uniref:Uncharacterized protein n=1 Tax=Gossypium stocksii TaxID=47602 RepID=A0A9D3VW40_9ROSI|nr:hypothetical protein J1N35_015391 [Gossypium stocksii]